MLAQAVRDAKANAPARKGPATLSQQLFPSSSPSVPTPGNRKINTLAPNPSAANRQLPTDAAKNSLKRTAAEVYQPVTRTQEGSKITIAGPAANSASGCLDMLHNSVSFDENDFVDDNDIDLDAEDDIFPAPKRPCSTSNTAQTTFATPGKPASAFPPPPSSVPIPWSSSPLSHKLPPALAPAPHASVNTAQGTVSYPQIGQEEDEKPPRRRNLPWLKSEDAQEEASSGRAAKGGDKPKKSGARNVPNKMDSSETPAKGGPQAPWNMTASAVKAEQQKYKSKANQGKKRIKEAEPDLPVDSKGRKPTKTSRKSGNPIVLSAEQTQVLTLVAEEKKSVFFTGSAGTGKSVLMREIIRAMRNKYSKESDRVAVTASTGLAACNIGGVTLHSFAGIGLGKEPAEQLVKKIKKNAKTKNRWLRTKVLIVDEISMIDGDLFDKLEAVARAIRNNARPFGGIQLVVTGDFFQLPPVPDYGKQAKFAFEASAWSTSIEHTIGLTQIFRQRDPEFAAMLDEMRIGRLSEESINVFRGLSRPLENIKGEDVEVQATELFPTRQEVESANNARLNRLPGQSMSFDSADGGAIADQEFRAKLLSNCIAPNRIILKKGAQVMLIKNIDESLVNGSIGQVIGFTDEQTFDKSHNAGDDITSSGRPARYGAASDEDEEDGSVSISRAKLRALINRDQPGASTAQRWPVVAFPLPGGGQRELLCQRESWKIELPNGEVQASRNQIPLILAWALSIHKAQGQTLESVKVDLGRIFEKGQAYVALSRATSQQGLQVLRFDPKKVMAHEKVRAFYDSLYNVDKAMARPGSARGMQKKMGLDRMKDAVQYPDLRAVNSAGGSRSTSSAYKQPEFEDDEDLERWAFMDQWQ